MKYSEDFKERAVKFSYEKTINFAAQTFGVDPRTIGRWRKERGVYFLELQKLKVIVKRQAIEKEIRHSSILVVASFIFAYSL